MCCIVVGKGKDIKAWIDQERELRDMLATNPHGVGAVSVDADTGESRVWRSLSQDLGVIRRGVRGICCDDALQIALHFRFATHGAINRVNCHPHLIGGCGSDRAWLLHNGCLALGRSGVDGLSDSAHLARILAEIGSLDLRRALLGALDGRFALVQRGRIWTFGRGWADRGGLQFSSEYRRSFDARGVYDLGGDLDRDRGRDRRFWLR